MKIKEITSVLEKAAPLSYQENYDNCGLITGDPDTECTGALCTLDTTPEIIEEAIKQNCNLIISHHPIVFKPLKKISADNYVEKTLRLSIRHDIAIFALHTSLDNVLCGVNHKIAEKIGLESLKILRPLPGTLMKLFTYVPIAYGPKLREALFAAGGGHIGNYSECSFNVRGTGTFKAGTGAVPFVGQIGIQHKEDEEKVEIVFPSYLKDTMIKTLRKNHPYEEVAFDIIELVNSNERVGSGIIGELAEPIEEIRFLENLSEIFGLSVIRHSPLLGKKIKKLALCGGAGSFLIRDAIQQEADALITSDVKYHEFFDAEGKILITDIGHWESEQYTPDLIIELLKTNFPTFAVRKSGIITNPVKYFLPLRK